MGEAGLQGWRGTFADAVARPITTRSGVTVDQVRAVVGATFFVLSVAYVLTTLKRLATRT